MSEGTGGLVAVHAHPDDEVIATGGVLARAADEGRPAAVVTCTGGELGEIVGDGMDPDQVRPRLAAVRREELATALAVLGAGEPMLLGYRDSGMMGTAGNSDPRCFWRADLHEAVGRVVAHLRTLRPQVCVTYDAFGMYGHPDHIQTHRVGVLATEAAAMPALYPDAGPAWRVPKVYLASMPRSALADVNRELRRRGLPSPFGEETDPDRISAGVPDQLIDAAIDVRDWLPRKLEALRAHRSQIGSDSFFLNTPPDLTEAMFGTECFLRLRSDVPAGTRESDLFAGL
jgi:N-acetyl-1-D-myo-inositol-2-amino-2-deoxy-alpha-D-glucopyranoside deacetylase